MIRATSTRRTFRRTARRPAPGVLAILAVGAVALGGELPANAGLGVSATAPQAVPPGATLSPVLLAAPRPGQVVEPFALTAEMRRWAHATAPRGRNAEQKLAALLAGLVDRGELDLEYSWGYTGTAREVFEGRRANCLAFTNLFLGLAREVGVPVYFLAVESETFRKRGDLVVVSDHVAVGYGGGDTIRMYDFSAHRGQGLPRVRRISDATAIAMFHSNRGVELLEAGRTEDALAWLRTAVTVDPGLASAWVNLGVAQRRAGDLEGAESAYRQALEHDPRIYAAFQNLASVLRLTGRDAEASAFERALRKSPNKNPFTYLALGDIAFENGRWDEARRLYKRALQLQRGHPEPWAALGQLAVVSGDLEAARKLLRKARRLDGGDRRTVRLGEMIASQ